MNEDHPLHPLTLVFRRASGDNICTLCGLAYWQHDTHPFLLVGFRVLCVGRVVKL